jgi:hypothetical protein
MLQATAFLSLLIAGTTITSPISDSDKYEAFCLVSAPPGCQPPEKSLKERISQRPQIRLALIEYALEEELLDKNETKFILANTEEFPKDLGIIQKRRVELADAPKSSDSLRLPDRNTICENIKFNRAYNKHLEEFALWNSDRREIARQVMIENQKLYNVWDYMRDAKCDYYYITVRRIALKNLKAALEKDKLLIQMCEDAGYDLDYNRMKLPPNVPVWRFEERR